MMGFDTGALLPLDKALQGMLEQLSCCCETGLNRGGVMRKIVVHVNLTDATTPLHTPPYPAKTGKMFDRLLRLKTKTTSSRQRGEAIIAVKCSRQCELE